MTKEVLLYFFILRCYITVTFPQDAPLVIPALNDTLEDDDFNLPPDLNDTSMLRMGHRTHDCQDFKKAYVCIMKCLELGYHIADSDKTCSCTCYKDYVKGQYFGSVKPGWKVPTTSLPPWAVQVANDELETYPDYDTSTTSGTETTDTETETPTEGTTEGLSETTGGDGETQPEGETGTGDPEEEGADGEAEAEEEAEE